MTLEFHDAEEVRALADFLTDRNSRARVALLSGPPASGRRHVLRAAVDLARSQGAEPAALCLDLDGYEPGLVSLADFLSHQAERRGADDRSARRLLEIVERRGGPSSVFDAALVSMLLGAPTRELSFLEGAGSSAAAFDRALAELSSPGPLAVHVLDAVSLPLPLRDRLIREAQANRRFRLIQSCAPNDSAQKVSRGAESVRFEFLPLDAVELRALAPSISEADAQEIIRASGGAHGAAARRAERVLGGEAADSPEPWQTALNDLPDHRRTVLENFLFRAALCGEHVPVDLLLEGLGAVEEDRDDWVDLIDETVGADSDVKLFDDRFGHPGLPDRLVYTFVDAVAAQSIRGVLPEAVKARLATELMTVFSGRLPPATRSAVRLYADLVRALGSDHDRRTFERALLWWTDGAETGDLGECVKRELESGHRPPQQVLDVITLVSPFWPAARLLQLVEALPIESAPEQSDALLHGLRAKLFVELQRFEEAEGAALTGMENLGDDPVARCGLLDALGEARRGLSREQQAQASLDEAADLRQRILAVTEPGRRLALLQRAALLRLAL